MLPLSSYHLPSVITEPSLLPPAHCAPTASELQPQPVPHILELGLESATGIPSPRLSMPAPVLSTWPLNMQPHEQAPEVTALEALLQLTATSPGPAVPPSTLHPSLEQPVSSRGQRLRKANVLSLNMCTCSVTITNSEINTRTDIMRCHVLGCETVWVGSFFTALFFPVLTHSLIPPNMYGSWLCTQKLGLQ